MSKSSCQGDCPHLGKGCEKSCICSSVILDRLLSTTLVVACIGLLVYKFVLTLRLNINWDEFHFLSLVYSQARGQLTHLLSGGYTHFFLWLPKLAGDEIQQIVTARWIMVAMLAVTGWLVWKLARIWMDGFAAVIAPFAYISAVPVMQHGGSFRYDSMLAPLIVGSLFLLLSHSRNTRRDCVAGALMGLSFFVTPKVVLFAPMFASALVVRSCTDPDSKLRTVGVIGKETGLVLAAALSTASALAGLHYLSIAPSDSAATLQFAADATTKTVLDVPWFPRISFLEVYARWQPLPWLLIGLGAALALLKRELGLATLVLALMPVVFYRNAFPYFYVVMMAPTCVLAGYTVQEVARTIGTRRALAASTLLATICLGLLYQGLAHTGRLFADQQQVQRRIVSTIHQVFPEPVNYIDRCGMISSYRKVNFFMSTWGIDKYRERNQPFMPDAIRDAKPAFVLVNSVLLDPQRSNANGLLPEDRELINRFYPSFWGPLRVAGAQVDLPGPEIAHLFVPFPGRYRIVSIGSVLVDGVPRRNGETIDISASGVRVQASGSGDSPIKTSVTLFLALAREPLAPLPPDEPIFAGL